MLVADASSPKLAVKQYRIEGNLAVKQVLFQIAPTLIQRWFTPYKVSHIFFAGRGKRTFCYDIINFQISRGEFPGLPPLYETLP